MARTRKNAGLPPEVERSTDEIEAEQQEHLSQLALMQPSKGTLKFIPVDKIMFHAVGQQPTTEFVENVRLLGIIEPINVTEPDAEGYYWVKGAGRRRVIAARLANQKQVPARITGDDISASVIQVSTHALRKDNAAAMNRAVHEILEEVMAEEDSLQARREIEKRLGLSQAAQDKLLKLDRLIPELFEALQNGEYSETVAYAIARRPLTEDEQYVLLRILRDKGKLTSQEVRAITQADATDAQADLDLDLDDDLASDLDVEAVNRNASRASALTIGATELIESIDLSSLDEVDRSKIREALESLSGVLDAVEKIGDICRGQTGSDREFGEAAERESAVDTNDPGLAEHYADVEEDLATV